MTLLPSFRVRQENLSQSHRGSFVLLSLAALVVVCAGIKLAAPILAPVVLGGFLFGEICDRWA